MTTLLELKEKMIRFYGKNEIFIIPIIRFAVALFTFLLINNSLGYMKMINKTPIVIILAAVCSIVSFNGLIVLAAVIVLLHLYALSVEVCLIGLLLFAVIYFIYFRFAPKNGLNAVLMPLCFKIHIPYALPVASGLLNGVQSAISVVCGTIVYFFIHGVSENASALSDTAEKTDESVSKAVIALNQLIGNKEMYLVLAVFMITVVIVYLIRRLDIEHAWTIAIVFGILFEAIGLTTGYMLLGITDKTSGVMIGSGISCLIAAVIQFFCFNLDYSRTERLQFEDDEYYYYVKAVPKSFVTEKDKQIQRFSGKSQKEQLNKKKFAEEMEIDENLLD